MEIRDERTKGKYMRLHEVAVGKAFLIYGGVPTDNPLIRNFVISDIFNEKTNNETILCTDLGTGKICSLAEELFVVPINAKVVINE